MSLIPLCVSTIQRPFIPTWIGANGLRAFTAELWLIATIVAILLTPFFTRKSNIACAAVALVGLVIAFLSVWIVNADSDVVGVHFRGLLVSDHMAVLWKLMLLLFTIGIVLMWLATTSSSMHEGDGPEFFTLLIGATLGMCLMASTTNLLMLFMAVEMASLPSYVLAGFRKTHRVGAEASLKYVLFGAATSSVMVYGLSMLYGLYGTLQIEELGKLMATSHNSALLAVALFGIIIGVGFKVAIVPFHFWCPDVFEGASIDVSAFLSVASKGAGLVLLLRVLMVLAAAMGYQNVSLTTLAIVIGILGSITATVGNTAAFVQSNIKRLLAYSSIAHAGYMLCALTLIVKNNANPAAGTEGAAAAASAQAILLYLAVYLFMNLGAFTVAAQIYVQTGSENINDYAALWRRSPVLSVCMAAFMFSLVGLPPFAGFVAKLNIMYVLGANGGWWWALVAVIGINTIFSLYYYTRVIKVMFLTPSDQPELPANPLAGTISVVCAIMLVWMLVRYQPLYQLTEDYGKIYLGGPGNSQLTTHNSQRNLKEQISNASNALPGNL